VRCKPHGIATPVCALARNDGGLFWADWSIGPIQWESMFFRNTGFVIARAVRPVAISWYNIRNYCAEMSIVPGDSHGRFAPSQ